jgi:hypothetical protein
MDKKRRIRRRIRKRTSQVFNKLQKSLKAKLIDKVWKQIRK